MINAFSFKIGKKMKIKLRISATIVKAPMILFE